MLKLIGLFAVCLTCFAQNDWRGKLAQELPLLGHRNWIAIVDSAYPLQTAAGIETIETNADQILVVREVLGALKQSPHVTPTVYLDRELGFVPESEAKGAEHYRTQLKELFARLTPVSLNHEDIIAKLDTVGKTFHVLVLKTKLTIPYSSVFLQLDCAYWDASAEKRLRERMAKESK